MYDKIWHSEFNIPAFDIPAFGIPAFGKLP
jgi:hypothetical protein